MKIKFFVFALACVLSSFMLFSCTASGDGNEKESSAKVVKISFAVESEDASENSISIGNPDLSKDLIYQYKAIPSFTLPDGSTPVGSTGNEWKDLLDGELSFNVGNWTFDVRIIQKGDGYESDDSDFTIIYATEAPLKTTIDSDSAKFIIFCVKKTVEGEGSVTVNITVRKVLQKLGELYINLYSYPDGVKTTYPITAKNENDDFNFKDTFNVPSGLYRVTFNYYDGNEEYECREPLIVLDRKESFITGKFDEIELNKPTEATFFATYKNKELAGKVTVEKIIFIAKEIEGEGVVLTIDGKIETKKVALNDVARKIYVDAEKKAVVKQANNNLDQVKVINPNLKEKVVNKELKPEQLKETIVYKFFVNGKEYNNVKYDKENKKYHIMDLKPSKDPYEIGVSAQSSIDQELYAKIIPLKITITK